MLILKCILKIDKNCVKLPVIGRDNFSGDSGYSDDSKINIQSFVIGYSNIMCSTCGIIHPQVLKTSFRVIQIFKINFT